MRKFILLGFLLVLCLALCACSDNQADNKALTSCGWKTVGLTPKGEELDVITLRLGGEEPSIGAEFYEPLEYLDEDYQDYYLKEKQESLVEFNGKKYYSLELSDARSVSYTEQGDTVVISVLENGVVGTITMVRTAPNQYTVKEITGRIIDSTITGWLAVGCVFTAVE